MGAEQALQALRADLEALRAALEAEDHDEAATIVGNHDRRLRDYLQAHGAESAAGELRDLLALQQSLMADMAERRDVAAGHLRAGRKSVRAANAYQQAESLG